MRHKVKQNLNEGLHESSDSDRQYLIILVKYSRRIFLFDNTPVKPIDHIIHEY
jgi:hypothetical protein